MSSHIINLLVSSAVMSALVTFLIVRFPSWHLALSADGAVGVQKFHGGMVPRIGGLPIVSAFLAALAYTEAVREVPSNAVVAGAMLTAVPVFLIGLMEDLTKRVEPIARLAIMVIAAFTAALLFDVRLKALDVSWLDQWLAYAAIGVVFTVFAVVGMANAFNIIDGNNGLVGMIAAMVLVALATVAWAVGDVELMLPCAALAGAIAGFLFWNYPNGRIFAGDGGAYFVGFVIAIIGVLLVGRHSNVSPWFPLAITIYPFWETVFTIYRRKVLRGHAAMRPDALHLHTLIYRRLCCGRRGDTDPRARTRRNALTSKHLWALNFPFIVVATMHWNDTRGLQLVIAGFLVVYLGLYWSIVRFRTPRWLVISSRAGRRRSRRSD